MFMKKLYQNAIITFDFVEQITAFDDTWCAWYCGHCLRVVPCSYNADQRDLHHRHVTLLAGLPKGTVAADLAPLINELKGKSVTIPFSLNSYCPKPYAYITFASEAQMTCAMDISCALHDKALTWHLPLDVTQLCHICGRKNCSPDQYPSRLKRAGLKQDQPLAQLYHHFKPAQH
ncbi:hypothetical protein GLOIN_2v1811259 [Rhizophagus clarus]|nr:hypothetical protein GLOIN_2v1811259 [Rhizophagus clarus]